jgi:hypothetical protein
VTSTAQIKANRGNAYRSTGPRTPLGRQASSQNARRHGLTGPPPPEAILGHLRSITGDPSATPETYLNTPIRSAALSIATAEARLDQARAHAAAVATRQPMQSLREEVEMVTDTLLDPELRFDIDAQASGQKLILRLQNFSERDDERTLRSARRHLAEAHAARRKALLTYVRLLS